jgi:hypothetical protein
MVPKANPAAATTTSADKEKGPQPVPRGLFAVAKAGPDQTYVDEVYAKIRKLADLVENRSVDLFQMDRDLRREMKNLEAITRKLAPPATPGAGAAAAAAAAAEEADLLTPPVRGGAAPMPMPPATPAPGPAASPAPTPKGAAPTPPAATPMPPAATPMPPATPMPKGNTPAATPPMPAAPAPPPMPAPAP